MLLRCHLFFIILHGSLYSFLDSIRCTRWIYWKGDNTSLGKRAA